jgi:hypothetical protein
MKLSIVAVALAGLTGVGLSAGAGGTDHAAGRTAAVASASRYNYRKHHPTTTTTRATTTTTKGPTSTTSGPTSTTKGPTSTTKGPTSTTSGPTSTTSGPTSTTGGNNSWWVPGTGQIEWQWELDHALSLTSDTDMGIGDSTYTGAPAATPTVYDIDGIDNPASTVSALHGLGDKVVCYIETGDVGNYYSAAEEGIATTYYQQFVNAGVVGAKQSGYPEYYLNYTSPATLSIVESMISQQCKAKGFDAVETDNDETWQYDTGFSGTTEAADETYMNAIANYIHSEGMAWFLKNCDDVGNTSFCNAEYPLADATISEQCNQYDTCSDLGDFIGHKAIFNAEYTPTSASSFCPSDNAAGFNGELFDVDLDGKTRVPCR